LAGVGRAKEIRTQDDILARKLLLYSGGV